MRKERKIKERYEKGKKDKGKMWERKDIIQKRNK